MSEPPLRYVGSAVILRSGRALLMQRKTAGYPFEAYVGRTTLVGGVWSSVSDASPRETMVRELREELRSAELLETAVSGLQFFGGFDYRLGRLQDERGAFWSRSYIYEVSVDEPAALADAELAEGTAEFVSDVTLFDGPMCWGHDATLAVWGDRRGLAVELAGDTEVFETVGGEEPESYGEVDRSRLVHDPLESG